MDRGPREAHLANIPYIARSTQAPTCFLGIADSLSFRLCQQLPRQNQGRGPFDITKNGEYRVD